MTELTPADVLESFLYENIWNRHERFEDEGWRISYNTPNFLICTPDGEIHNIKVVFEGGDLSSEEMNQLVSDAEWEEEDE